MVGEVEEDAEVIGGRVSEVKVKATETESERIVSDNKGGWMKMEVHNGWKEGQLWRYRLNLKDGGVGSIV